MIPWLGFFHKATQADLFVLLDNVQYRHKIFKIEIESAALKQPITVVQDRWICLTLCDITQHAERTRYPMVTPIPQMCPRMDRRETMGA